jgi:hypothetical protein
MREERRVPDRLRRVVAGKVAGAATGRRGAVSVTPQGKGKMSKIRKALTIMFVGVLFAGLAAVPVSAHTSGGVVVHHGHTSWHQNAGNMYCNGSYTIEVNIDPGINSGIVGKYFKMKTRTLSGTTFTLYRRISSSSNNRFVWTITGSPGGADYVYSYIYNGWSQWDSWYTEHSLAQWCN